MRGAALLSTALALAAASPAQAAEALEPETVDGFSACAAFEGRVAREQAAWAAEQPKIPYKITREETILGGPWVELTRAIGHTSGLLAATFIPHIGAQLRAGSPALTLSFPWSFPFGPAFSCSRDKGTFVVRKHFPNRLLLEPAVVPLDQKAALFLRPGYRLLVHPSEWAVGLGGGVGSTLDLFGFKNQAFRPSVSPELVVQFGHCCDRGYIILAFRADIFFSGEDRFLFGGNVGYTYF